jgi:hypothetical protein
VLHRVFVVILASAGCAEGVLAPSNGGDDEPGTPDANTGSDGSMTNPPGDGSPPGDGPTPQSNAKLLLTEIVLAPSTGEFIEIANPGSSPIDLSGYYLSDSGGYFRVPTDSPTVDSTDFIVKFPAGAMIPAQGVVTIAIDTAANFMTTYGAAPTYSLATMTPVATSGIPSLTNGGEIIVLFSWDGTSDNVRDVDLLLVGAPTAANGIVDKSGVVIDGPDANSTGTAYKSDARTIAAQATVPASGKSTKRTAQEAGFQTGSAGNGVTGADETSENTAQTWDTTYTAPTPGVVPAGLM